MDRDKHHSREPVPEKPPVIVSDARHARIAWLQSLGFRGDEEIVKGVLAMNRHQRRRWLKNLRKAHKSATKGEQR